MPKFATRTADKMINWDNEWINEGQVGYPKPYNESLSRKIPNLKELQYQKNVKLFLNQMYKKTLGSQ